MAFESKEQYRKAMEICASVLNQNSWVQGKGRHLDPFDQEISLLVANLEQCHSTDALLTTIQRCFNIDNQEDIAKIEQSVQPLADSLESGGLMHLALDQVDQQELIPLLSEINLAVAELLNQVVHKTQPPPLDKLRVLANKLAAFVE